MPNYKAVLLDWGSNSDLGPIDLTFADDDNAAIAIGTNEAMSWQTNNGIDRVRLLITKDGRGFATFELTPDGVRRA